MARKKRMSGGRTIRNSVEAEAKKTSSEGFKRGGAMKKEMEPDADDMPARRADRRARGGRATSPFSSARDSSERGGKSESGHEGE